MRAYILISVLILSCNSIATADLQIGDPNGVLSKLDDYLGPQLLAQAFKCQDQAVYTNFKERCQIGCGTDGCSTICEDRTTDYTRTVAQCTTDDVKVYSDNGDILELNQTQFESLKGNLARLFLQQLDIFLNAKGRVTLEKISSAPYLLYYGTPQQKSIDAVNIEGTFYIAGQQSGFPILLTVGKQVPSVAQIFRFRFQNSTWFMLKDFKRQ